MSYLEAFHKRFTVVAIDKTAYNFAFICKKCYISKLLADLAFLTQNLKHIQKLQIPSRKYKLRQI